MEEIGKNILVLMEKVLQELDKIALKPKIFTNEDYLIKWLIMEKKKKILDGRNLEIMLEQAKQISFLSTCESIMD